MNNTMNKKITVYPFSREFLPYLTEGIFFGAKINTLVSPTGFALTGKDAGYADNRPTTGFLIQPEAVLNTIQDDILLIPNGEWAEDIYTELTASGDEWKQELHQKCLRFMENAADAGKEIWCAMQLTTEEKDNITNCCRTSNAIFMYFYREPTLEQENDEVKRLYTPEAAVVFVNELSPNTNAYEIALGLHQQFTNNEFCSVLLAAQEPYTILNAQCFPNSLYLSMDEERKVHDINNCIKNIEDTIAPDVIIICLPDALMKYDSEFTNGFGINPYIISQAVRADYGIVCVQHDYYNAAFYNAIQKDLSSRFSLPVKFFHTSNAKLDLQASRKRKNLRYSYFSYSTAKELIMERVHDLDTVETPICNVLDGNKGNLFHHLLECLQG